MKNLSGNIFFYGICAILVFILLCQFGIIPLRFMYVRSGSMSPTFLAGDLAVISVSQDMQVNTGDVILFHSGGEPVIHRAVAIDNGQITTQGDANNTPDLQKITRVDGKYLFAIPKLGYAVAFIQSGIQAIVQLFHF
jgi:signal peptidase I